MYISATVSQRFHTALIRPTKNKYVQVQGVMTLHSAFENPETL
jgi:hypothetical protein